MDIMFKASSLLLLTLVLNVQLCSSAPISAKVVQLSAVAEEPGPEELAPVTEDHSHFIEEKESIQEKLIPIVAGEAAPSPEESPAEEDMSIIAKEPETVFIGDRVFDDADEAVSQESAPQEPLAAAPQESSEEETIPVATSFAEASPDETTEEVAPAVAVERESQEQHYVEDPAPEASIPVIPLEASEDEAPEENAKEETAVVVENAVENESPEQHGLEPELDQEEQEETVPIIPSETKEKEGPEEPVKEDEALSPVVLEEHAKINPATNEEPLPCTLEEEVCVTLVPAELETEEAGQGEPAAEETAPEESAPEEPAEQELDQEEQEETVPIISSETKEEEAPEEHAKEEAVAPVVLEEHAKEEEEESIVLVHVELDTEEEDQEEVAAEETAPEELAPEEPAVIIPMEPAEPELDQEEQKETVPIIPSETKEKEGPEEPVKEDEAISPVVLEEHAKIDPATNEEPLPSTLEEEVCVTLVPAELETEEAGQGEPAAEETAPEESAPEEPAEQELDQEEQEETVPIISSETKEEEAPEEHAKEEAVAPVVLEEHAKEEEEESIVLVHAELDTEEEDQEEVAAEETAPAPEKPAVTVLVEPNSEELAPEDPIHIIHLEDLDEDAPEILPEAPVESVTAPAPAVTDAEVEIVPAPVEGGNGTSIKTHSEDFTAAVILIEDEPVALVNRGTVLGAAFFTLMSFITIGFVGTTVSRKLR